MQYLYREARQGDYPKKSYTDPEVNPEEMIRDVFQSSVARKNNITLLAISGDKNSDTSYEGRCKIGLSSMNNQDDYLSAKVLFQISKDEYHIEAFLLDFEDSSDTREEWKGSVDWSKGDKGFKEFRDDLEDLVDVCVELKTNYFEDYYSKNDGKKGDIIERVVKELLNKPHFAKNKLSYINSARLITKDEDPTYLRSFRIRTDIGDKNSLPPKERSNVVEGLFYFDVYLDGNRYTIYYFEPNDNGFQDRPTGVERGQINWNATKSTGLDEFKDSLSVVFDEFIQVKEKEYEETYSYLNYKATIL